MARAARAGRRPVRLGARLDLRAPAPVLRGNVTRARHSRRRHGRALPRHGRRLGDDRPHLARRRDQAGRLAGKYLVEHGVERKDFNSYGCGAATTR
jgi:hypothetical protein